MAKQKSIIPVLRIENRILMIRGHKVIIDRDLAKLYGVPTKRLNEQVKRNRSRFPDEFILQLTKEEFDNLKSHFATSSSGWGGIVRNLLDRTEATRLPIKRFRFAKLFLSGFLRHERALNRS